MVVADAYVAMWEVRPSRDGLTKHWSMRELRLGVNLHFGVDIVGVFLDLDQQRALDAVDQAFAPVTHDAPITDHCVSS